MTIKLIPPPKPSITSAALRTNSLSGQSWEQFRRSLPGLARVSQATSLSNPGAAKPEKLA
ncbi:MAG TPA: hypothetical protein VGD64_15820 [Acidisarcina sp.]